MPSTHLLEPEELALPWFTTAVDDLDDRAALPWLQLRESNHRRLLDGLQQEFAIERQQRDAQRLSQLAPVESVATGTITTPISHQAKAASQGQHRRITTRPRIR